ncbi:nitroreductase [Candidatus Nomurabacteria bacterium RIFCSPHIGHO2_02_FULL_37_45]|uniref:Nitroreductase n=2 Tax=Candidatus Nomuraibacteriota TaxID=1752729 RepID=A0A1F6Y303_9BACT|nr:MAG: nitroreductase [Candidatus Nomurabacteria bacterium RIFCSPHIGHO2_01_FULL_37_110]OGI71325.1 MAG: nitroreductase [Candidatus Nomurabacteria bacterium RIFCSPHIGHO2_02_FULL_37_45]OGI79553.1 MAG: nitroreductase [Candidatus Nomurabacteria bacterium RIFCSPHIGHO2_12_FULL_37_29]OGI85436.1 MAG: nitroreductase [Candidatus Nomurabacteria bacterium RIFCSPLOWO2_01_FULL_37_49]OGJ00722.1 MAG: nitroreductase [Candidatus Nomurabacteria bacterium RIFCSPLOWO2_12_FULL_37_8]
MKEVNGRTTEYPIDDIFLKRYSPRAMSGESISKEELMTLFDAARWAPSSYNAQPWRFIYAMRDTPEFDKLFSLLVDFNKSWCIKAAVLIVVISKKTFEHNGKDNVNHSSDIGAAWENLALQAQFMNLVAHGMNGFDYARAKTELGIPDDYFVEMMIAIGKHGKVEDLPESLREGEKPNDRKKLEEIIFEGKFSG